MASNQSCAKMSQTLFTSAGSTLPGRKRGMPNHRAELTSPLKKQRYECKPERSADERHGTMITLPDCVRTRILSLLLGKDLLRFEISAKLTRDYLRAPERDVLWQNICRFNGILRIAKDDKDTTKSWRQSYVAAINESVLAFPFYACGNSISIEKPGEYAILPTVALAQNAAPFPWREESSRRIETAMHKDRQMLLCELDTAPCCLVFFRGMKFLFVANSSLDFGESSDLETICALHFRFETGSSIGPRNWHYTDGFVVAPTKFLSETFSYNFHKGSKRNQKGVPSYFTKSHGTKHYRSKPIEIFRMHQLPTYYTAVQLFTIGTIERKGACRSFPEECHNTQGPWFLRMGCLPADPQVYLGLALPGNSDEVGTDTEEKHFNAHWRL